LLHDLVLLFLKLNVDVINVGVLIHTCQYLGLLAGLLASQEAVGGSI